MLMIFSSGIWAQGVYNNGGKIVIGSGVSLTIGGISGNLQNETNGSNGSIDLSGTLKLTGNLTNNVAGADILTTSGAGSKIELNGTSTQTIGGSTTSGFIFPDLTINNVNGVLISKNALVNGTLTLTNGLVDISNNDFTFGASATISGTPSATSMIIATGSGQVKREWSATGTFTFPVGDNTVTPEYSPVTLNITSGTFGAGAYTGVNLVNTSFSDPFISGSYLNRYWNITQTGISSFMCNAFFNYEIDDITGNETDIFGVMIQPAPASLYESANTTLHQLSANGLTSFGTFTGGLGQRTLNLTAFLEGLYNSAGSMRQASDELGAHWAAGIADNVTIELHSAVPGQYSTINFSAPATSISTTGLATIKIPATYKDSYFLTIKHRNSIETVSASPILFSAGTIAYDFSTSASKAYGSNMKNIGGKFILYGGDVNQDGIIDISDMIPVDNLSASASMGYLPEDVNGDGLIDISDMIIIDNNSGMAIGSVTP